MPRFRQILFTLCILSTCTLFLPTALFAQDNVADNVDFIVPDPNIAIPGLQFTTDESILKQSSEKNGDGQLFLQIPFLAEYLAAIYRYAVGISGVVAVIIIIISGFQWSISGGSPDTISQAKGRITNAVTGLLLVLGSYSLLYAINPELVRFRALAIPYINESEIEFDYHGPPLDESVASPIRSKITANPNSDRKWTASDIAQENHNGALRAAQYAAGAQLNKPIDSNACPLDNPGLIGKNGEPQQSYDEDLLKKYANCLTADYRLLKAIAQVESRENPNAVNKESCYAGLFQTKRNSCFEAVGARLSDYCTRGGIIRGKGCSAARNPAHESLKNAEVSTMVGTGYLRMNLQKIQRTFGNTCTPESVYYLAYVGHHGGTGAFNYALRNMRTCDTGQVCRLIYEFYQNTNGGIYRDNTPPPCAR